MFYFHNGVPRIQLGTGDVAVGVLKFYDNPNKIAGIAFTQCEPTEIGSDMPDLDGKRENEVNAVFELLFTDVRSIDVVLSRLEKAKEIFLQHQNVKEEAATCSSPGNNNEV